MNKARSCLVCIASKSKVFYKTPKVFKISLSFRGDMLKMIGYTLKLQVVTLQWSEQESPCFPGFKANSKRLENLNNEVRYNLITNERNRWTKNEIVNERQTHRQTGRTTDWEEKGRKWASEKENERECER